MINSLSECLQKWSPGHATRPETAALFYTCAAPANDTAWCCKELKSSRVDVNSFGPSRPVWLLMPKLYPTDSRSRSNSPLGPYASMLLGLHAGRVTLNLLRASCSLVA